MARLVNAWSMRVALAAALCGWLAAGAPAQELPDGPGKAEVETQCTTCHSLGRVVSHKDSLEGWRSIVDNMVGMGAMFTDEDKELMAGYLFQAFPDKPAESAPPAPPADTPAAQAAPAAKVDARRVDVKLGEGAATEFVVEACTQCHALSRLTAQGGRTKAEWADVVERMVKRGAQLNDLKSAMVIDYLAAAYPR